MIKASRKPGDFQAGDVVAWDLGGGVTHIGIVSDRPSVGGVPSVIYNIGRGAQEEDILFRFDIIGHYRPRLDGANNNSSRKPVDDR